MSMILGNRKLSMLPFAVKYHVIQGIEISIVTKKHSMHMPKYQVHKQSIGVAILVLVSPIPINVTRSHVREGADPR